MPSPAEEIKQRLDLAEVVRGYLKLEKSGANFRALCPFHQEKTPSLFVSPSRQVWRCFGCGEGGDIFTFVEKIEGVEFRDSLTQLAQRAGVELKQQDPRLRSERKRLYEACELACAFFQKQLDSTAGEKVRAYLLGRGITEESIRKFRIGYAPRGNHLIKFLRGRGFTGQEIFKAGLGVKSQRTGVLVDRFSERIMFSIFDISGRVIAFGGRVTEELQKKNSQATSNVAQAAKYINSPQTPLYDKGRILYGLDRAKVSMRREDAAIIVEGYTDVVLAHQNNNNNVVSSSGTALTEEQLVLLQRFTDNLMLCFDMDIAGDNATKRGIDAAQRKGFNIKIVSLPKDEDPADVLNRDPALWQKAVEQGQSILEYYLASSLARYDVKTPEGKKAIAAIVLPAVSKIPNSIERAYWIQRLAQILGVAESDVSAELMKLPKPDSNFLHPGRKQSTKTREDHLKENLAVFLYQNPSRAGDVGSREQFGLDKSKDSDRLILAVLGKEEISADDKMYLDQILLQKEVAGEPVTEDMFWEAVEGLSRASLREELNRLQEKIREQERAGNLRPDSYLLVEFQKILQEYNNYGSKEDPSTKKNPY